jgi:histidinol-phosphate aminotransferase
VLATVHDKADGDWITVAALNEGLLRRGVIVRPVGNYELPHSVRITVGTVAEDDKLIAALDDLRGARG